MDFLLGFKEKATERKYYNELGSHLQLAQTLLLLKLFLKEILYQSLFAMIDLTGYLPHRWEMIFSSSVNVIGLLIVFIIKRIRSSTKHSCRLNPKYVTWVTDCAVVICAFYVCHLHIYGHHDTLDFLDGWILFFRIFFFSFLVFNWFPRALLFIVILFILGLNWESFSSNHGSFSVLNLSFNLVMAFAIYYSVEKSNRKRFLERNALLEKSEAWKKMINEFPDGMMLMDKHGKLLFCNKALEHVVLRQDLPPSNSSDKSMKTDIELADLTCFEKISVAFCDERVKKLRESASDHGFTTPRIATPSFDIEIQLTAAAEALFQRNQGDHNNLSVGLNDLLLTWSKNTEKKTDDFFSSLPNDQQLILLDSQLREEEEDLTTARVNTNAAHTLKSFQIKIWLTLFEGQRVFALLFSETTQMKLIHQLQDRDAYRSRLLASVSHELRTPLNGSLNFMSRVAEDSTVSTDIKEKYVIPAIRSSTLLLNLINDILDFSQLQVNKLRLTFEMGNIIESIHECLKLFEIQAKMKGISLVLDYSKVSNDSSVELSFCTDHKRFKQILLNLISNAIKFSHEKGVVKVLVSEIYGDSSNDDCEGSLSSPGSSSRENEKRFLKIAVEDQGIGIPKEEQKKLFTEFAHIENYDRASVNPNGVGLGLMISNLLAIQLGERFTSGSHHQGLEVASEEGNGTTFSFVLEDKSFNLAKVVNFPRNQLQHQKMTHDEEIKNDIQTHDEPFCPENKRTLIQNSNFFFSEISKKDSRQNSLLSIPPERYILKIDHPSELSIPITSEFHLGVANLNNNPARAIINSHPNLQSGKCLCPQILVVDDDSFNIMAIESILQSINLNNHRAFNGKEGIQKALHRAQNPCSKECCYYKMILMDCTMPVMNGFEAARKLKEFMKEKKIPATTIIACTALAQTSDIQEALAAGMDDYCVKPLSKDKILSLIQKVL